MYANQKKVMRDEVVKNLLSAHKRIADSGSASDLVKLSRYLMRISKQFQDVLVDISPNSQEKEDAGGGKQNTMYEFVVDDNKGVVTLGGHTVERMTEFQIKANGPTEQTEVILHVMVDRVKVDFLAH